MHILKGGTILGVVLGGYTMLMAATGLFTNTFLSFWVVLAIELAGAIWFLRARARRGNGYFRQLAEGTLVFAVAAVVLAIMGYFALAVIAPDYGDAFVDAQRQRILAAGNAPPDLEERLEVLRGMYTPLRQSMFVIPATIVTGILYSATTAIFLRKT
jgi:hypothetical protein